MAKARQSPSSEMGRWTEARLLPAGLARVVAQYEGVSTKGSGMEREKITVGQLACMKRDEQKISMVTVYDYPNGVLVDRAGIDIALVGDSVAMTVLGHDSTLPVSMDEMLIFAKAVTRGCKRPFVIGDMPYMSYQASNEDAVRNAGRFMGEAGTDGVKLEGGGAMVGRVQTIVQAGIPVMGHLGLTPQSMSMLGGLKVQAKTGEAARHVLEDALRLEEAGVFAILLELVPSRVAQVITERVGVPTISIGSGADCDGQCLIFHDLVGLFETFMPRHVKRYASLADATETALKAYTEDVRSGAFPGPEHGFKIADEAFEDFMASLADRT